MVIKRTTVLFPAAFLMNLNLTLVNFAVIFFLKDSVGITASTIGWFFAAGSGGYVLGCVLLRPVQNKIKPPVSMLFALGLSIFSILMITMADTPAVVLIFYLTFSTAPAFYWPQLMGWFSYELPDRELSKAISRFNISWSTGALTGPFIGGMLVERGLLLPFYADIAVLGAAALLITAGLLFIKDMRIFPVHTKAVAAAPVAHEAGLEDEAVSGGLINGGRGTILRYAGWIGVFSTYIVLGLTNNIFPLFIRDTLGFGESIAGNILFVRGLTTAAGFYLAGRIISWHFNGKVMIITQAATAVAMLFLLFIKTVSGFYILFIFYGLLFSLAYANAIFHGSAGALDRGRRMGLFESFLTMGVITGSIGGGYLFQYFSIYAAFVFCFIIITVGLGAQLIILREGKRRGLK